MSLRSQVSVSLLVVVASYGALFACVGDDPAIANGGGVDAGIGEASVASDAKVVADGAVDSGVDASLVCSTELPFHDDFSLRKDLVGCWDGLTKVGALATTSTGELGVASLNQGFRVSLVPPDAGSAGGGVYLSKKVTAALAPVRLAFTWTPEWAPAGGGNDGSQGLYAVKFVYQYKDTNKNVQAGSISMAFGAINRGINPYLAGDYTPVSTLMDGPFVTTLMLSDVGNLTLSTTTSTGMSVGNDRIASLPSGTEFAVTEIGIGVTEVGSITEPWTLFYDNVILEKF